MKMEPEDLCKSCTCIWVWLSKILVQVLSKVNDLNVEPVVPYTLENFSRNVILTLKPWNIECIILN